MKKKILYTLFFIFIVNLNVIYGDIIILKDDQKFNADVISFDKFYLNVRLENKKEISIPWREVKYIKHTTTPSNWLEETYITSEDVEVKTYVVPLKESIAFQKAIFPGFLKHGEGFLYAKNKDTAMSLLSAEIVSLAIMIISANEILNFSNENNNNTYSVTDVVFLSGVTLFIGSWLYDVIFSPGEVKKYNSKHKFLLNQKEGSDKSENSTRE